MALAAGVSLLPSCISLPVYRATVTDKKIGVDPAAFLPGKNALLVRAKGVAFDILLLKESDCLYTAVYMQCTHQENTLSFSGKKIICNAHGSEFDLQGKVTMGPAVRDLRSFPVTLTPEKIFLTVS
jgi:Rieske Fe-S protein